MNRNGWIRVPNRKAFANWPDPRWQRLNWYRANQLEQNFKIDKSVILGAILLLLLAIGGI
jgi:hypothetical protein